MKASQIGFTAYASIGLQVIHYGGFTHQWNVPATKVMHFLQVSPKSMTALLRKGSHG